MGTKTPPSHNVDLSEIDLGSTPEATAAQDILEPLKQTVQEQLSPLLRPEKRGEAEVVVDRLMVTISERFSGPLAHPAHLEAYERIVPGSAKRLMDMAEGEQGHRHRSERFGERFEAIYSMAGLICGFVIGSALVIGGVIVALYDHEWVGGMFVAASAVGMVSAFIRGRDRPLTHRNDSTAPDPTPGHIREFARTDDRQRSTPGRRHGRHK
jgi:uncharacterized membrane protein